jgi:exodeoxyribonuclease VII small subunit
MRALEEIVRRLERGDLPLEEALAAFEQGVALVRKLNERLTAIEGKVEVLTRSPEGQLTLTPYATPSEEE